MKRPRLSETESRKHVETIYNEHHKVSPTRYEGEEPAHHLDAIYDTHHHIPSGQNRGATRHPSSPPRIHSPTHKQNKRDGLRKTPSVSQKPDPMFDLQRPKGDKRRSFWRTDSKMSTTAPVVRELNSEPAADVQRSKSEKRRSFWRKDSKTSTTAPAVREPEMVRSATDAKRPTASAAYQPNPIPAADVQRSKSEKRRSFWRTNSRTSANAPAVREPDLVRSARTSNGAPATEVKPKRNGRRLSFHRSTSGQGPNKNRLSWLSGGAGDSDDSIVPAQPPVQVKGKRPTSRSMDRGRNLSFGEVGGVQPGNAATSNDLYYNTAVGSRRTSNSMKPQNFTKVMISRTSTSDAQDLDPNGGSKRKRRSWFSGSKDNTSRNSYVPPVPALPTGSSMPLAAVDPSQEAFQRFLHNVHNAQPRGATTDYERFLNASRAYDDSMPTPPHLAHQDATSYFPAPAPASAPSPVSTAAPTALPTIQRSTAAPTALPTLKRSTAPGKHASHCRPRSTGSKSPESPGRAFMSDEQQREWNKLREYMDDSPAQEFVMAQEDQYDDDGVIGMVRQLSREEDREARALAERKRRDYERGYWANDDALARLSGR